MEILSIILILVSTPWIILALFSTLGDAGVGFLDDWLLKKIKPQDNSPPIDAPGQLLLISGFFGGIVSVLVFIYLLVVNVTSALTISIEAVKFGVLAGVLEIAWLIPYFYALNRGGAINTTPLFQSIPIFSLIFGLLIFNETPTGFQIFAVLVLFSGALLLNYSPKTKQLNIQTLLLMLCASAIISAGLFIFKDSAVTSSFSVALFWNGVGMFLMSFSIWSLWPPYRKQFNTFIKNINPKILLIQSLNEGLYAITGILNQLAIFLGPSVMIVSSFYAFQPLFILLIGWVLTKLGSNYYTEIFNQQQLYIKIISILLIMIGASILIIQS